MTTPVVRVELKRANAAELIAADPELSEAAAVRAVQAIHGALGKAVLRRYLDKAVLWQQGEDGGSLLVVLAGAVRVFARRDKDNAELGTARKGGVLGEAEVLLDQQKRRYSAVAQGQVDVMELPRDALVVQGALPVMLASVLKEVQAERAKALDELSDFLNRW